MELYNRDTFVPILEGNGGYLINRKGQIKSTYSTIHKILTPQIKNQRLRIGLNDKKYYYIDDLLLKYFNIPKNIIDKRKENLRFGEKSELIWFSVPISKKNEIKNKIKLMLAEYENN